MENPNVQQKLPNDPMSLILSLVGTLLCCGVIGLVMSIIAFNQAKKAMTLYESNPDGYLASSYSNQKTAKTIGLIAIILNAIGVVLTIVYFGAIMAMISSGEFQ